MNTHKTDPCQTSTKRDNILGVYIIIRAHWHHDRASIFTVEYCLRFLGNIYLASGVSLDFVTTVPYARLSLSARHHWPAHRAGLLWSNFFGQPGSVSKFPPFLWVKLWMGWVGRGYTEISRYFPASWINWVTLVTKKKLLYSLRFEITFESPKMP